MPKARGREEEGGRVFSDISKLQVGSKKKRRFRPVVLHDSAFYTVPHIAVTPSPL